MRRLPALRIAAFAAVVATGLAAVNAAARSPTLDAQPVRSEEASRAPVPLPDSVARGGGLSARLGEGDRSVVPASPLAPQPLVSPKLIERPEVTPPAVAPTPDTVTTTPAPPAKGPTGLPLKVTPPLKGGPYVFPVTGGNVIFGDTYGAFRTDVPGGWHHGDDIFAPLGTPVVAVAKGTVNRVGWQRLGGWRLWVRDDVGDEFYYAHLSGYTPFGLKDKRVHAGEVLGYVGNTGDAFTTLPHLHFEVHPRSLLHLGYNGAVDPTKYLDGWRRIGHTPAYEVVHPQFPRAASARLEAVTNFRELLRVHGPSRRTVREAPPPVVFFETTRPTPAPLPVVLAVPGRRAYRWAAIDAMAAIAVLAMYMWRRPFDA